MRSILVSAGLVLATSVAAACGSSGATAPKITQKVCPTVALSAGALSNDLDTADACLTANALHGVLFAQPDSTLASDYSLRVQGGDGFVVTMQGLPSTSLTTQLDLLAGDTLLAASPSGIFGPSVLAFVNGTPDSLTVRATAVDSLPSDTGAYVLRVQSCKVPLAPITDSTTHTDVLQSGDCALPSASFVGDSSHLQLYSVHVDSATQRRISITSPGAIYFFSGGAHDDTFGVLPSEVFTRPSQQPTAPSAFGFLLGLGRPGYYTLAIGTTSTDATTYTLTVGSEQATP